jgi:hypothetical protein
MKHLAVLAFALGACGGGSKFDSIAQDMEGVYQVGGFTHNDAACSPGGSSQLGTDQFAIVTEQTVFGIKLVSAFSCSSTADCHDKKTSLDSGDLFISSEWSFGADQASGDSLVGNGADTGFADGSLCKQGSATTTTFALSGEALSISQEITIADDYPVDSQGFCSTDAARAAAANHSCSQFELLTATFVESL